jgi:hypothetical protein
MRHRLLSPERVAGRAFLLETPIDLPGDDRRNVAALWKLVGVAAVQAPDAEDGFSMVRKPRAAKSKPRTAKSKKKVSTKKSAGKKTRKASPKSKKRKRS